MGNCSLGIGFVGSLAFLTRELTHVCDVAEGDGMRLGVDDVKAIELGKIEMDLSFGTVIGEVALDKIIV